MMMLFYVVFLCAPLVSDMYIMPTINPCMHKPRKPMLCSSLFDCCTHLLPQAKGRLFRAVPDLLPTLFCLVIQKEARAYE